MTFEVLAAASAVALQLILSPIPEVSTIKVLGTYLIANLVAVSWRLSVGDSTVNNQLNIVRLNIIFLASATASTVIHRLYFSPLSSFPGPKFAAISKLWAANQSRLGRTAMTLRGLHDKYKADVIRIGPNEVSISNVDAIPRIYGGKPPQNYFYKLRAINGEVNVNTTPDYAKHSSLRKIWERALSSKELMSYDTRLEHHVDKFVQLLKDKTQHDVDCVKLMNDIIFDITMDLAFAKDAGMQDGTGDPFYVDFTHKYAQAIMVTSALRNVGEILSYFPDPPGVRAFRNLVQRVASERRTKGASRKDIFHHFFSLDPDIRLRLTPEEITGNTLLTVAAGFETTSTSTAQTLRLLAKNPQVQEKLRVELDTLCDSGVILTVQTTRTLPYLNAVINEGLRIFPPVPSGVPAVTRPEGVQIGDYYIPGNVEVKIPYQVLMTDPRYFPQGDCFIPERWTGEMPYLSRDRRVYIPFGYGAHACVGKQMALNEMRLIIARSVREFEISLGHVYDDAQFLKDSKDYITFQLKSLYLKFSPRREEAETTSSTTV